MFCVNAAGFCSTAQRFDKVGRRYEIKSSNTFKKINESHVRNSTKGYWGGKNSLAFLCFLSVCDTLSGEEEMNGFNICIPGSR